MSNQASNRPFEISREDSTGNHGKESVTDER